MEFAIEQFVDSRAFDILNRRYEPVSWTVAPSEEWLANNTWQRPLLLIGEERLFCEIFNVSNVYALVCFTHSTILIKWQVRVFVVLISWNIYSISILKSGYYIKFIIIETYSVCEFINYACSNTKWIFIYNLGDEETTTVVLLANNKCTFSFHSYFCLKS